MLAAGGGTYQGNSKWAAGTDYAIYLWNEQTGKLLHRLTGHTATVHGVALDVRKNLVVSGSSDRTLRVWNGATGKELFQLGKYDEVNALAFGRWPTGAGGLPRWHSSLVAYREPQPCAAVHGSHGGALRVAFSKDGKLALSGGHENTARLWDVATGKELRQLKGHTGRSWRCPVAGWARLTGSSDRSLRLWDTNDGSEIHRFGEHATMVESVAFSPDGKWALSGCHDACVAMGGGERTMPGRRRGHTGKVFAVAFSPNGKWALTGATDAAVRLWQFPQGQLHRSH